MAEIQVTIANGDTIAVISDTGDNTAIAVVSDGDNSTVEKSLIKVPFNWGDAHPKYIYTALGLVHRASIVITEAFNTPTLLSLGDDTNPNRLVSRYYNNPNVIAEYETAPIIIYSAPTPIKLFIELDAGNTQGKGFVVLEI